MKYIFLLCLLFSLPIYAQNNKGKKSNSSQQEKNSGKLIKSGKVKEKYAAGFHIGVPTGLNFSMALDGKAKLHTMLAYDLVNDRLQVSADWRGIYFSRFKDLVDPFIGVGATFLVSKNMAYLGARVPIGIEYVFPMHPLSAFLELVPTIMIFPKTLVVPQFAVGIQFRF